MYRADLMLMESGLFWCVFDAQGRVVHAFYGAEAEDRARRLASDLNREVS